MTEAIMRLPELEIACILGISHFARNYSKKRMFKVQLTNTKNDGLSSNIYAAHSK